MDCIRHHRLQMLASYIFLHPFLHQKCSKTCAGGRFNKDPLRLIKRPEQREQILVLNGDIPGKERLNDPADQRGRAGHRQTVRRCSAADAEILHTDLIVTPGRKPQQHAACFCRLREEAVHVIPIDTLQSIGDAARCAADAAGNVDKQRMPAVHDKPCIRDLTRNPLPRSGITQKQIL